MQRPSWDFSGGREKLRFREREVGQLLGSGDVSVGERGNLAKGFELKHSAVKG